MYLHGRGGSPSAPLGALVAGQAWRGALQAPSLDDAFCSRPLSSQLADVHGWLERSSVAIGHSWGAWLLLCACEERGSNAPPMLLLSPILGRTGAMGRVGFRAPRAGRIRRWLGLEGGAPSRWVVANVVFVLGHRDPQLLPGDAEALSRLGVRVEDVEAGHGLRSTEGRAAAERWLEQASAGKLALAAE